MDEVLRLERKHNDGQPFPEVAQEKLTRSGSLKRATGSVSYKKRELKSWPFMVELELVRKLRNAAGYLGKTMSEVIEDGVRKWLLVLKKHYNEGKDFENRNKDRSNWQ